MVSDQPSLIQRNRDNLVFGRRQLRVGARRRKTTMDVVRWRFGLSEGRDRFEKGCSEQEALFLSADRYMKEQGDRVCGCLCVNGDASSYGRGYSFSGERGGGPSGHGQGKGEKGGVCAARG